MRKNDLVALRAEMGRALSAIEAIEKSDAYWENHEGDLPEGLPEVGRLRRALFNLSQTIIVAKRLPGPGGRKIKV
jgi:hypothetical protein